MGLRPPTSDQLQQRIAHWAGRLGCLPPQEIPIYAIGPKRRSSIYNVRDFCRQHNADPVYGWALSSHTSIFKVTFCAVVKLKGELFSVTDYEGASSMVFFEERRRAPRYLMTQQALIVHTFHALVYPETKPARKIDVVSTEENAEVLMALPTQPREPEDTTQLRAIERRTEQKNIVVHPLLRKLKNSR